MAWRRDLVTARLRNLFARLVLAVLLGSFALGTGLPKAPSAIAADGGPVLVAEEGAKNASDAPSEDLAFSETAEYVPEQRFAWPPATPGRIPRRGDFIDLRKTGPPRI